MPISKTLLVIVLAVVVLSVYLFFTLYLDQEVEAVTTESIRGFVNAGQCAVAKFDNPCSGLVDSQCKANPECLLCDRLTGSSPVRECGLAVCGCTIGWTIVPGNVVFWLDQDFYRPGDVMTVTGKIYVDPDEEAPEVKISFTDEDRNDIDFLGEGTVIGEPDSLGNYVWEYRIPDEVDQLDYEAVDGRHLMQLDYSGSLYFLDFRIHKNEEFVSPSEQPETDETEEGTSTGTEQPPVEEPSTEEAPDTQEEADAEEETETPAAPSSDSVKLGVFMIQFGDFMTDEQIEGDYIPLLKQSMLEATDGKVELDIDYAGSKQIPHRDYSEVTGNGAYDYLGTDSVPRVWYHNFGGGGKEYADFSDPIFQDIFGALGGFDGGRHHVAIVISEAQIIQSARYYSDLDTPLIILEQPVENGIGDSRKHSVKVKGPYMMVDESIHEIGHYLGLGHHCGGDTSDTGGSVQRPISCSECASESDVMSYCYTPEKPSLSNSFSSEIQQTFRVFESCSMREISKNIKLISTDSYNLGSRLVCNDRK